MADNKDSSFKEKSSKLSNFSYFPTIPTSLIHGNASRSALSSISQGLVQLHNIKSPSPQRPDDAESLSSKYISTYSTPETFSQQPMKSNLEGGPNTFNDPLCNNLGTSYSSQSNNGVLLPSEALLSSNDSVKRPRTFFYDENMSSRPRLSESREYSSSTCDGFETMSAILSRPLGKEKSLLLGWPCLNAVAKDFGPVFDDYHHIENNTSSNVAIARRQHLWVRNLNSFSVLNSYARKPYFICRLCHPLTSGYNLPLDCCCLY